jgi:fibronectin-binding autotransporter adhesin
MFRSMLQIGKKIKQYRSPLSANRCSSVPTKKLRFENLEQRALLTILTWDPDGLNNGQFGGSGNWAAAGAWVDTATSSRYTWNSGRTGDEAVFKGTAGTVTVNTAINAGKLNFIDTDGYTLANGGYTLTLSGNGATINAAQSSTINANITTSTAAQQWVTASAKTLSIGGTVTFAGRQLLIQGAGTTTFSNTVSGADFRANGGGTATFTGASSLATTSFTLAGSGTAGTINWNSSGNLTSGSTLYVGFYGLGTFTQTAGNVYGTLRYEGSSSGTSYNINGGALNTLQILGNPSDGLINPGCSLNFGGGTLRVTGTGSLTASNGLICNVVAGTTSYIQPNTYNAMLNAPIVVNGNGILDLSNGNVTVRSVKFQNADGGVIQNGSLWISGGGQSVVADQSGTIDAYVVANGGNHQWLTAAGKTLSIKRNLSFGSCQLLIQGVGTTSFNGAVSGIDFRANNGGTATFTGSSSLTTSAFTLAGWGTSGTINWNSTGALNPGNSLYVGFGGAGTFTQTAGNVNANALRYEGSSSGTAYNLNGGSLNTPSILGNPADGNINAGCSLNFGGGTLAPTAALSPDDGLAYSAVASTASTINNATYAITFAGVLSGSGNLTKTGTGTLTLVGNNSSYSGNINISQGELKTGANNSLGASSGVQMNTNTTLNLDNHSITLGRLYSTSGGTVQIGTATFTLGDGSSQTFAGGITGTGSIIKQGTGTLTLTGTSYCTGTTTISQGSLQIGNGGTTGSYSGNITNNSTLIFNRSDNTMFNSGVISGTGSVIKLGTGTLSFWTNNTYTGGTTISQGTLEVGSGLTGGSIVGNVTNNGTLTFNRSDELAYSGVISGTGSVVMQGTGTLILTGENTYTGGTTISNGALQLGNGYSANGSVVGNIINNSDLRFAAAVDQIFSGDISGSGYLEIANDYYTTLTLSGTNTHTGDTSVFSGTLKLGSDYALSYYGMLGVYGDGLLDLNARDFSIEALYGWGTITDNNTTPGTTTLTVTVNNGFTGTVQDGLYRTVIVQ